MNPNWEFLILWPFWVYAAYKCSWFFMNFPPNSFYNFVLFSPTFANDQINPFHFQIYFLNLENIKNKENTYCIKQISKKLWKKYFFQ